MERCRRLSMGLLAKASVLVLACIGLVLSGCALAPRPPERPDPALFADHLFAAPAIKPDVGALFRLTPAMRRHLVERIEPQVRRKGPQRALVDALYTQGDLRLEYDAKFTRTAAQAFDAKVGNCLSLVIMTAAFANEMGLMVRFQDVLGAESTEEAGELTFVLGHVNLALGNRVIDSQLRALPEQQWLTIDFVPGLDLQRQQTRPIEQRRITAMFMNNRAAEELSLGRVDEAYWWLRSAFAEDPGFVNLYNTLGVVYRHRGALAEAERALRLARHYEPGNSHVADNLAGLLRVRGGADEAQVLAQGAAAQRAVAPLRFAQAREALEAGNADQALRMLQGELGITPRSHELHYWLAVVHGRLGDARRAQAHLELAAEYSAAASQRSVYAGKLERLKAQVGSTGVQ